MNTKLLIVAAGSSSRLGQPKQLLPYKGTFLLNYTINQCLASGIGEVNLVLGANADLIIEQLDQQQIQLHINPEWQKGMGKSIAYGIQKMGEADGVIIIVGDQPFLTYQILRALYTKHQQHQNAIILSKYSEGKGPPTYFPSAFFQELRQLNDDRGAKLVVQKHKEKVKTIQFFQGHIDIDKPDDLSYLSSVG